MNKEVLNNKMVSLLSTEQVLSDFGEAVASIVMQNPSVVWAKFILTDDLPNGNGMRVPKEEFANIIKSGVHMPVKMVEGSVENHEGSKPLGVITHLIEQENKVVALAALWHKERPSDVDYIKNKVKTQEPVDVSWEIYYSDYRENEETSTMDLLGTSLSAATIVKNPAYEGRTPFLAVAGMANKWSKAYIDKLPDNAFLHIEIKDKKKLRYFPILDMDGNLDKDRLSQVDEEISESGLSKNIVESVKNAVLVLSNRFENKPSLEKINKEAKLVISSLDITEEELDELQELKNKVSGLESKLDETKSSLKEKEDALAEKEATLTEIEKELKELRDYKAEIEAIAERAEKLEALKNKFKEAGIEKDDKYFEENEEKLLNMDDETLDFVLQEMVSFASKDGTDKTEDAKASKDKKVLPAFTDEGKKELSPKELAKALRESKRAK